MMCIFMGVEDGLKFSKPILSRVNSSYTTWLDACAHQQWALGGKMNNEKAADGDRNTVLSSDQA